MKNMFLATALLAVMSGAAAAQEVHYNYDRQTDFSTFKTYKWVTLPSTKEINSLTDQQIKAAVDVQLGFKGLTKVADDAAADLYITYQSAVDKERQFVSYGPGMGWGYGPGWYAGGWYGVGGMAPGETVTIYTGTLAVDIYNSSQHNLIWRGTVDKTIHPDAKPDKQQRNLNKAVTKLFEKYPPPLK